MGKPFGSRTLIAICAALVVLLGVLAFFQYRWSTRVAAADAQRETEHLQSAASLFADKFNAMARQAVGFLQENATAGLKTHTPVAPPPKLIAHVYYVDYQEENAPSVQKLMPDGRFGPAVIPEWAAGTHCAALVISQPVAIITPLVEQTIEHDTNSTVHFMARFQQKTGKCFIAELDQLYLQESLFPELIHQSFGGTTEAEYDFDVLANGRLIYGKGHRPDLHQRFFSAMPGDFEFTRSKSSLVAGASQSIIVARVESTIVGKPTPHMSMLVGLGAWDLQISHKNVRLAEAFEQTRRRNLLLSLGVESLLLAAIAFLVLGARRMERLADQKMNFVAGVSHELRTPVSAIAMLSRNQADGLVTGADRVKQYGELIHHQSQRLNEMVEQTLQYAGIRSGRTQPARQPVDLARLIEETVDSRREELTRGGFEVELAISPELPEFCGDLQWLRTAVDNLLSNAQKHAGAGRWIRVSAAYLPSQKEVRISVEDRGNGIDPADQSEIFEPFSRGRAAIEAQVPGSGLGLSLVRSAVEAHRGSVTLASEPGRGSTFTLHLPV